ncbi:MAG: DUF58 domain-containing protein [Elusimicrobia bacterium]|nr:DUF58 domain-containing protein [Elusimicrobiota bacterium]
MLSAELIAKVRRLEITSAKLVEEMFAGQYLSVFKGRGIEFSDVRDYQWGDDIRAMHWKAMARFAGKPFIKRFAEERQLTVILAVDVSGSQDFGSASRSKRDVIQDAAGLLTYMAMKNKDRAGLFLFSDRAELYLPARSGRFHALRILRELVAFQPSSAKTDILFGVKFLLQMIKKRSIIFLISDFLDSGFETELSILAKKHDVIAVSIEDPAEKELPSLPAKVRLEDAENSGSLGELDLRRKDWLELLSDENAKAKEQLQSYFDRAGMDHLELSTTGDLADALTAFFKKRRQKKLAKFAR